MAQASLIDLRGQGAPADIGTFVMPVSVVVYTATFSGNSYICAARQGDRGWVLIGHLLLSGANATTVINAALASLTAGRTWKEVAVVIGNYTSLGVINVPSYITLVVQGYWTAQVNLNTSFVVNAGGAGGNTDIEICGSGTINGNRLNQAAGDESTIFMQSVMYPWVHHLKVFGGRRTVTDRGEGIELFNCTQGIVAYCDSQLSDHDCIKFRGSTTLSIVANCTCVSGNEVQESSGIQFYDGVSSCVAIGNTIQCGNGVNARGMKIHAASDNLFTDNQILNSGVAGMVLITVGAQTCNENMIVNNTIVSMNNVAIGISVYGAGTMDNNRIVNNTIKGHLRGIEWDNTSAIGADIIGNKILPPANPLTALAYGIYYLAKEAVISGNTISGNGLAGETGAIYLVNSSETLIEANSIRTFSDNSGLQAAIYLINSCVYIVIIGNKIRDEGRYGIRIDTGSCTYIKISDNFIYNSATGISVNGTHSYLFIHDNTVITVVYYSISIIGCDYTWIYDNFIPNGTPVINKSGLGIHIYIYYNYGWVTENTVLGPQFAVGAVALVTFNIPHGLSVTPAKQDCCLTLTQDTVVTDFRITLMMVTGTDGTNVACAVYVSTASATGTAKARLGLKVTTGLPNLAGG